MKYVYLILAIFAVGCGNDQEGLEQCAKACKDSGSTMKQYYYGRCECHSPHELKIGISK